jgi:hypothetical protein
MICHTFGPTQWQPLDANFDPDWAVFAMIDIL